MTPCKLNHPFRCAWMTSCVFVYMFFPPGRSRQDFWEQGWEGKALQGQQSSLWPWLVQWAKLGATATACCISHLLQRVAHCWISHLLQLLYLSFVANSCTLLYLTVVARVAIAHCCALYFIAIWLLVFCCLRQIGAAPNSIALDPTLHEFSCISGYSGLN